MKPTFTFGPELFDNKNEFNDPFFKRHTLRHAPQPLKLTDTISKNYLFPTLYGNVTAAMGIFFCNYKKAESIMLHPKIKPINMLKNRSLVIFSCYEYKNVLGIPSYNEIAMTIPVLVDPSINIPLLPMLMPPKNFGYYVFSMPVTSAENNIRGHKIWGLPKVVNEIDITHAHNTCATKAYDEKGEKYFELSVPTTGKETKFDVKSYLYSKLDGKLLKSETNFKGNFNVTKKPASGHYLTLGPSPTAQFLKDLEINPQPFQFRYTPSMNACFDLANPNYQAPFGF
ncbi:acetoacetate decarboxylase family protein [bacterium]|nr:acetoacetate decarboxylase family protein [bacterium]